MKKLKFLFFTLIAVLLYTACEDSDNLRFTVSDTESTVEITTTLLDEYRISEDTEGNLADRLSWSAADFGAPVNVTYEVQGSIDGTTFTTIEETTETSWPLSVDLLLDYAADLGLDDDPATTTETGNPNNVGQVFFRVRAYVGSDAALEKISDPVIINIFWIEQQPTGAGCDPIFGVGAGLEDAGWDWGTPIQFNCEADVYTGRAALINDTFRFFTESGNWDSGQNYPFYSNDGYTIDADLEDALDGDNNFRFIGTPGIYDFEIDDNNKTITLTESGDYYLVGDGTQAGWSWDNPVVFEQVSPYIYEASVDLNGAGAFRIFTDNGNWDSGLNYPYYSGEGFTIDANFEDAMDGDNNFKFTGTDGTYTLTLDEVNQTITLQ